MQALSISNPSPAIAQGAAPATLLPFGPPPPSPFTAVFQAVLKGTGNNPKLPPSGKPSDSGSKAGSTPKSGSEPINFPPQELFAPTLSPILPDPPLPAVVAPFVPDPGADGGPARLFDPPSSGLAISLATNSPQPSATAQAAAALPATRMFEASNNVVASAVSAGALPPELNVATRIAAIDSDLKTDPALIAGDSQNASPLQGMPQGIALAKAGTPDSSAPAIPTNSFTQFASGQNFPINPNDDPSFAPEIPDCSQFKIES